MGVNNSIRGVNYGSYEVKLTQSGINNPIKIEQFNNVGDVSITRNSDGNFIISSAGLFTNNMNFQVNDYTYGGKTKLTYIDDSTISMQTFLDNVLADSVLNTYISIKIFPTRTAPDPPAVNLEGKNLYFFGDSITVGVNATIPFPDIITDYYNAVRVDNNGSLEFARSGTTLMKQIPINYLNFANMVDWATPGFTPIFDENQDGLLFVSYLTNDVGINLTNYNLDNWQSDIDLVISGLITAGWPLERIKFNVRYFLTEDVGLDYDLTPQATLDRYNDFADALKVKLTLAGIQYFDHWDILSAVPDPVSHLDAFQRHPDNFMHNLIAKNIIDNLTV